MQFRTEIKFESPSFAINHHDKIFSIGSCFADNIGKYLQLNKFNVLSNPFGVLYNPVSISNAIKFSIQKKNINDDEIVFNQSEWHSFFHHSDFSAEDKFTLIEKANNSFVVSREFLNQINIVIITFGTANVYRYKKSGLVVSNCHKLPQNNFVQEMLSVDEVTENCNSIIQSISELKPDAKFIFSVSPIRHIKDGFVKNSQSKSTLILGVKNAIQNNSSCFYFPAYEIMMDDLRDYRFYKDDLLHPNDFAIEYIWNVFKEKILSKECNQIIDEIRPIILASNHRVRNPKTPESQSFFKQNLDKIKSLKNKYSYIDFEQEEKFFSEFIL